MRRLIQFRLVVVLLLVPTLLLAGNTVKNEALKTTKEKTIQRSFDVNSNATLKVDNSYGNVDVITWDENRIEFDITIRVTGNNEEKVREKLQGIDVEFSSSKDMVSAVTKISKNKKSWWNWGSKMNLKLEINYVIKAPITNNVNLSNDYGSIAVDKLEGRAVINCDYGKITTKELMADNNALTFDYSNGCYFEYIKSGSINADYSGFTVAKTKNLDISADYTKSVVEAAEDVSYNCDYGSMHIENANNVEGNGDYLTLRLGNIYKNVRLKADYGSIKIDRMASKAKNINIESDYTGITIGYDSAYNFNFDINLEYGSLRNTDDFEFIKKRIESGEKYYYGYYGNSNTGNKVSIDAEYGSITFKKS